MIDSGITSPLRKRLLLALPAVALAASLAACAGTPRPAVDDVAAGLEKVFAEGGLGAELDADASACLADYLVDSELSDATLNFIAGGEDKQSSVEDRDLTQKIIEDHMVECTS